MRREEHLAFCKRCKHQHMDFKKGLLCGKTMELADFENTCDMFEEQENNKKSIPTDDNVIEDSTPPKKYWDKLGVLLGVMCLIAFVQIFLEQHNLTFDNWLEEGNRDQRPMSLTIIGYIVPFVFWIFLGWELKVFRNAIISGAIQLALSLIFLLADIERTTFLSIVPFLGGTICFSILHFKQKNKVLTLIGAMLVTYIGLRVMFFIPISILSDQLNSLLDVFDIDRNAPGIFSVWITDGDRTSWRSVDFVIIEAVYILFLYLIVSFTVKYLEGNEKWKMNIVSLTNAVSSAQMGLFLIVFYTGIFFISLGLIGIPTNYFNLLNYHDEELGTDYFIYISLVFICGVFILLFISWLYRKIVVEFYLSREQPLAWNYLLGQMPVLGLFIWMGNLITFKKPEKIGKHKISTLIKFPNQVIMKVAVVFSLLGIVLSALQKDLNMILMVEYCLSFSLFMTYLLDKKGIYILVSIKIFMFLGVMMLQYLEYKIPEDFLSLFFFFGIARLIILYPVFHSNAFKVKIPANKDVL